MDELFHLCLIDWVFGEVDVQLGAQCKPQGASPMLLIEHLGLHDNGNDLVCEVMNTKKQGKKLFNQTLSFALHCILELHLAIVCSFAVQLIHVLSGHEGCNTCGLIDSVCHLLWNVVLHAFTVKPRFYSSRCQHLANLRQILFVEKKKRHPTCDTRA